MQKNKNVVLFSTLHSTVNIDNNEKKKPETVQFYNSTKFGVDVVDQMARKYSVKSSSRRWPVQVFYNILDLAAINAWVLYKETTGKTISRRKFILKMCEELRANYVRTERNRPENTSVPSIPKTADDSAQCKRRHCQIRQCDGNKASESCSQCNRITCGKCTATKRRVVVCVSCAGVEHRVD